MVFSSSLFLVYFLPVFLATYYLIAHKARNYFILLASLLFYSWGAPAFVFVLLGSTILDFYIVKALFRSTTYKTKKNWLVLSIAMNVGLLIYFKYANFFVENFNAALAGIGFEQVEWTKVALPIGISFYTFQTLTYSIDVFRGTAQPLKRVSDYLLYIMMFPQMIAGPIVRFNSIREQITNRAENWDDRLYGLFRFAIGLGKKVLIANVIGLYAHTIMTGNLEHIDATSIWIGVIAFGFQIYFDFSGYSDMAIGLGKMMGFTFPENFDNPYTSKSITEFWRRWHITLGAWMRDYLYIPLGGSQVGSTQRMYVNLCVVFLISGLWHGAAWNFLIWGAFHGFFLVIERMFLKSFLERLGSVVSIIYTLFIVMVSWAIFAAEDLSRLGTMLKKMFFPGAGSGNFVIPFKGFYFILGIAIAFSFITLVPAGQRLHDRVFNGTFTFGRRSTSTALTLLLVCLCLSYVTASKFNPFIYFRF